MSIWLIWAFVAVVVTMVGLLTANAILSEKRKKVEELDTKKKVFELNEVNC